MNPTNLHRMVKWLIVAGLSLLISWFAFRGYLNPSFLVGFSLSC